MPARAISEKYAVTFKVSARVPETSGVVLIPVSSGSTKCSQINCTSSGVLRKNST
ncbi:MAG: hypothetical protein OXU22_02860 [Gammaproteobacteria bacterium]|nr:hypothetical protein [Gammaproteobacteria bacterium]